MLKRTVLLLILAAFIIPAVSFQVLAGTQDFILVNETGVDICELYISPSNSDDWEEDMLDGEVFEDGDSIEITFDGQSEAYWDIMVVDSDGNGVVFKKINLKKTATIILHFDGEKAWATLE